MHQIEPKLLTDKTIKFKYLYNVEDLVIAMSESHVYELYTNSIKKTKYKNPFDYYCKECQLTYKTIHLNLDEVLESTIIEEFEYFKQIGSGGFGTV
ncbi:MAG: hypothetical protein O7C60_00120 [Rickettsia endosymbiont of Ixodes persulcatus]|nr:hypothetical protein [Rickettsia endosymbiont of Ixodes persulcatus]